MKIVNKLKDGYIPYQVYEDVDPKFRNFAKFVRVLPADYFDNPGEYLTLKAMYQPGEKKSFPNGGFEVYHDNGTIYNYDLDQVIVHPYVLGIRKFGNNGVTNEIKEANKTPGKKGRKPLSPEERAKREELKANKVKTGKRGRPSKYTPEQKAAMLAKAEARKGGKRGRKKKTSV